MHFICSFFRFAICNHSVWSICLLFYDDTLINKRIKASGKNSFSHYRVLTVASGSGERRWKHVLRTRATHSPRYYQSANIVCVYFKMEYSNLIPYSIRNGRCVSTFQRRMQVWKRGFIFRKTMCAFEMCVCRLFIWSASRATMTSKWKVPNRSESYGNDLPVLSSDSYSQQETQYYLYYTCSVIEASDWPRANRQRENALNFRLIWLHVIRNKP